MSNFEAILNEYKDFNASIFQLRKKKSRFEEQLKDQILKRYQIMNMCTPLDNDYISAVLNFKKKTAQIILTPKLYE